MSATLTRRGFARSAGAALCSLITPRKGFSAESQEQRVTVHPAVEIGTVSPLLHGSFAEHLGSCVYGGLWVGPNSSIPNINGYRRQAVEYLKALGIPVLRWPGGCFADDYHWRDGVGPAQKRPRSVNIHWGNYVEDNSFGTQEFIGLCRLIGAEPYLAGNVGSGTPQELRDWVEYCNYPSDSSLSSERAANGSREPFRVRYWGVGNENWGCGGNMSPEDYATEFRRFVTYVRSFGDTRPFTIACGPNRDDVEWTRRFMNSIGPNVVRGRGVFPSGFALHFYQNGREVPTRFTVEALQEQVGLIIAMEKAIVNHRGLIDSFLAAQPTPQRPGAPPFPRPQVQLLVDEWGVWDRMIPEEEKRYGRLWMQSTMRSAVVAGMGLNAFHRQAARLYMCNIAQTVNVLQSILLAHENHCIRTSTYYAFELQKPHRSKTAVHVETGDSSPMGVSVSASRSENELLLTFINPKHDVNRKVNCSLVGAAASSGKAQILHHPDYNACNTFENPNVIVPKDHAVSVAGSRLQLDLPPISMATVTLRLVGLLLVLFLGLLAAVPGPAMQAASPADQIAAAILAAPQERRSAATVLGYDAKGEVVTLRQGSNDLICLADNPDDKSFSVACYHKDLEPFMARGRELAARAKGSERHELRWKEVEEGKVPMPRQARMLYVLTGSGYDAAKAEVTHPYLRWVIYVPYATPESTGLSTTPGPAPWLMYPGTPGAHIMISPPKK